MTDMHGSFPPVFVMNPYYTGLGIARCLRGLNVDTLVWETDIAGVRSRRFRHVHRVPSSAEEPEALCRWLLAIKDRFPERPVIFPTRDFDVMFLYRYRDELAPFYRLPPAEWRATQLLVDKLETARLADAAGVPWPKTVSCASVEDLEGRLPHLRFPLVVKPRCAYQWRGTVAWAKVGARKAFRVESADELRAELRQIGELSEVLLQEFVAGADSNIVTFCCYIGSDGEVLGHFTARKARQSPPLFGTGCVVELADVREIVAPSVRLLREARYAGIAEVEYKFDPIKREFLLLEVNPRHWDQHELGLLAGVNISRIAYECALGNRPAPQVPTYQADPGRWVAEGELAWATLQRARRAFARTAAPEGALGGVLREWWSCLARRTVFSVCRLDDPRPGIFLWSEMLGRMGRAIMARLGSWASANKRERSMGGKPGERAASYRP
jgi:predicted ATP-grasp superfamily ATP-dependent carboligase